MFYLVMSIFTALAIAVGFAIHTKDETPESIEYVMMVVCAIIGATLWPIALVVLAMGGVFWLVRDFMKKSEVQIPEAETGESE